MIVVSQLLSFRVPGTFSKKIRELELFALAPISIEWLAPLD